MATLEEDLMALRNEMLTKHNELEKKITLILRKMGVDKKPESR